MRKGGGSVTEEWDEVGGVSTDDIHEQTQEELNPRCARHSQLRKLHGGWSSKLLVDQLLPDLVLQDPNHEGLDQA